MRGWREQKYISEEKPRLLAARLFNIKRITKNNCEKKKFAERKMLFATVAATFTFAFARITLNNHFESVFNIKRAC